MIIVIYKFVLLCLQGWVIAHISHVVPRKKYLDYERANPYVGRWTPKRGFADVEHFRGLLDSMEDCHVSWRPYEHRRDVAPFFRTCAGTPDGSWPANRGWCVTCRSGF